MPDTPDDEYDGPTLEDLAALYAEHEDETPKRRNVIIAKTIHEALLAADARGLEPWISDNGRWLGLKCPVCKHLGRESNATIEHDPAGFLKASCATCHDDVEPGILETLGAIHTNGSTNVVPLHPEHANGTQPQPSVLAWIPLDLVTLGDTPRIPPAISGLIYPGRRHILTGESESGKTWAAIGVAADELKLGHGVVWADLDFMGAQDILERLRQFEVPDNVIRELFTFYQPDGALEGHSLDAVLTHMQTTNARYVVLDAFTGLCHLHKLNPNDGIDIEHAYRCIQPLCDEGAGVAILDHVVKAIDQRGRYASGSERKLSGADVAIGFQLIEIYGRGKTGRTKLTIHKDRPAMLTRPVAGIFTLKSDPNTHNVTWSLEDDNSKGEDGKFRPTHYMERISRYLEKFTESVTRNDIIKNVEGKAEHLRVALDCLNSEGYTHEVPGGNKSINVTLVKAFREDPE